MPTDAIIAFGSLLLMGLLGFLVALRFTTQGDTKDKP